MKDALDEMKNLDEEIRAAQERLTIVPAACGKKLNG